MDDSSEKQQAIELLQELGLKEYESRAFVALTRLSAGTAKQVSDHSEIPRTRVYDAVRVLEEKGLVEIQDTNPKRFRAVPVEEAASTLRNEYNSRTETLRETLQRVECVSKREDDGQAHEVWSLSGKFAIRNRANQLVDSADSEVIVVLGQPSVFTEELSGRLWKAHDRGADVLVGTVSERLYTQVESELPEAHVFVSDLDWLSGVQDHHGRTDVSRLLLVDRDTLLVSTLHRPTGENEQHEQAVFGRGFQNGFVVIARRLIASGIVPADDPLYDPP